MNPKQVSTKINPLAFFQYLFSNESLSEFENEFYHFCDKFSNSECNKKEGYRIIFHHTTESNGNELLVNTIEEKQYFNEYLQNVSRREAKKTYNLLLERVNELVHENSDYDKYLQYYIKELHVLQTTINKLNKYKIFFTSLMTDLEISIKKVLKDKNSTLKVKSVSTSNLKKSYFGAENLSRKQLEDLYQISIKFDVIDDVEFTEEHFIKFFSSENPYLDNLKFTFRCNNIFAINYIDKLRLIFKNFNYSTIAKSESFYGQKETLLKQFNLDNMLKTSKRESDINRLEKLNNALDDLIKKVNIT